MSDFTLEDLPDGDYSFGEFDTLTHVMDLGIVSEDGFTTYVMRHRVRGDYVVEARLESDWMRFADEQPALDDYFEFVGFNPLFSGTWFVDDYQCYWVTSTKDESQAWDMAFAVDLLLKTERK